MPKYSRRNCASARFTSIPLSSGSTKSNGSWNECHQEEEAAAVLVDVAIVLLLPLEEAVGEIVFDDDEVLLLLGVDDVLTELAVDEDDVEDACVELVALPAVEVVPLSLIPDEDEEGKALFALVDAAIVSPSSISSGIRTSSSNS